MDGRQIIFTDAWHRSVRTQGGETSHSWATIRLGRTVGLRMARYVFMVLVPTFRVSSVFGFALLLNMVVQM